MNIRVAAFTSGRDRPSTRFRVRQHLEILAEHGVVVKEFVPAIDKYARLPGWPTGLQQRFSGPLLLAWNAVKLVTRLPGILGSRQHHLVWLQRDLLPGLPTLEGLLKKPLVFDVDDAVWLDPPLGELSMRRIARRADVVVTGNNFLADWFAQHCRDVRVVPTAIDTERFRPRAGGGERPFTIGWTGLASNFAYLRQIQAPLQRFLAKHDDARLLVMADKPPAFVASDQVVFWPWSKRDEVAAVQSMDIGLMPLPDAEWSRGKCSFKMLQYMACAVPVIVSPVGMNAEILQIGEIGFAATRGEEWYEALELLYRERDQAREMGRQGRMIAERHFERRVITRMLAAIFHDVLGTASPSESDPPGSRDRL